MEIRNLSEDVLFVTLPKEPQLGDELKTVNEIVSNRCDYDVVIDFSRVEILTSVSISNLMILNKLLSGLGHRLILCNVSFVTKCIFTVIGVKTLFEFADDKFAALALCNVPSRRPHSSPTETPEPV